MPATGGGSSLPTVGPDGQPQFTMEHMLPILRRLGALLLNLGSCMKGCVLRLRKRLFERKLL
jgi:hypothetical protein